VMAEIERQNLDQKLYQTQKLESLGVMAGGIAHDFNNLLTGIIGNVEFVREDLSQSSKSDESLKLIEQASYQASQLCSQMLAYAGKGKLEKTFIQLNDHVEETWKLVQHSIDKRINVNCDLDLNLPKIFADSTQIRQIIMNLMINAGDAIGEKFGEINIQTRSVTLNGIDCHKEFVLPNEKEGLYLCLQVKDTGVGMSEETIKRIFEPFYTTKFTGRGLGLSAVLGMIKGHQGALSVESTVGSGTIFQVYFPLLAEQPIVSSINTSVTPWHGKGSVLLVEDEPLVREISVRRLKGLGFEVYEAEDGLAGWEQFQQFHGTISLVITDLTMPKLNGGELLNKIREIDLVTPCIVMSAYGHEEIQNYLGQYSHVYFLKKPGNRDTFLAAVKRAYENKNRD